MAEPAGDVESGLPTVLADRYRLKHRIGTGGMSAVYAADDMLLQREVAIKIFRTRADTTEALRSQEAEAKLVAQLNHYALTVLFDAGVDASDPAHPRIFLVMEYVPGRDLKERLRQGALDWRQVCYLGFDLAEGLDYIHTAGYLHRDLKPANVLLATRGADVRVRGKLTDFGISSIIGARDADGMVTGTAAYLSPEQVEGEDPRPASDVYSLGLVLLEAVTGTVAYPGTVEDSAFDRLDRQAAIPDSIPPTTARIFRAMTARRPEDRPTASQAAAMFQDVLVDAFVQQRSGATVAPVETEAQRLEAVRRYDILGTPSEDAFDHVTRLASRLLEVPIALVSIVDADRVWHKSRLGTDVEVVDRNMSFCTTTDDGGSAAWTVPDATRDERTRNNPFVLGGPQVRSYAAAPLITHDGHRLGTVCVFDQQPREFTDANLADLSDLAEVVMRELELRLASRRAIFDR